MGHNNYRYFLLFLVTTGLIAKYGAYLVVQTLRAMMDEGNIHALWVIDRETQEHSPISFKQKWLVRRINIYLENALIGGLRGLPSS